MPDVSLTELSPKGVSRGISSRITNVTVKLSGLVFWFQSNSKLCLEKVGFKSCILSIGEGALGAKFFY